MSNMLISLIDKTTKMDSKERITRLCELSVKEMSGSLLPNEEIEYTLIQEIRRSTGEIDKVLKNWEDNPDTDPRKW